MPEEEREKIEQIVQRKMTREALERYGRVRLTHPDVADQALAIIAQTIMKNNTQLIDDTTLRRLLMKIKRT